MWWEVGSGFLSAQTMLFLPRVAHAFWSLLDIWHTFQSPFWLQARPERVPQRTKRVATAQWPENGCSVPVWVCPSAVHVNSTWIMMMYWWCPKNFTFKRSIFSNPHFLPGAWILPIAKAKAWRSNASNGCCGSSERRRRWKPRSKDSSRCQISWMPPAAA